MVLSHVPPNHKGPVLLGAKSSLNVSVVERVPLFSLRHKHRHLDAIAAEWTTSVEGEEPADSL
jgi:hypothetical protein